MPYSELVLSRARARLAEDAAARDSENERRIRAIHEKYPRLKEIEQELRSTTAQVMQAALRKGSDPSEAVAEVRKKNLSLQEEWDWIVDSEGIDRADLEPAPLCSMCGGRGYVGGRMCSCLHELCRQEQKKELASLLGGRASFETFRLDLYPDTYRDELGASPRGLMSRVYDRCLRYARTFSLRSPSLLFSGGTGLGKTFLSAAIARTVADGGFGVEYETAGRVFADFEEDKFGEGGGKSGRYFAADLLILDDLGTEMTTQFTLSALYALLNGRLLAGSPTIISTNLTTNEIRVRYTPQIASRLLGGCELLLFAGNDIRLTTK